MRLWVWVYHWNVFFGVATTTTMTKTAASVVVLLLVLVATTFRMAKIWFAVFIYAKPYGHRCTKTPAEKPHLLSSIALNIFKRMNNNNETITKDALNRFNVRVVNTLGVQITKDLNSSLQLCHFPSFTFRRSSRSLRSPCVSVLCWSSSSPLSQR